MGVFKWGVFPLKLCGVWELADFLFLCQAAVADER